RQPAPTAYWFVQDQIKALIRSLRRRGKRLDQTPSPRSAFDGVFEEDPRRFTLGRAGEELIAKLRAARLPPMSRDVVHFYRCRYFPKYLRDLFPGGELPVENRLIPGTQKDWVATVGEDVLEKLAQAIIARASTPKGAAGCKSLLELCDYYGVR